MFLIVYRHRMSDSLLGTMMTNLQNKVTYHAFNAVTDPDANEFASNQTAPLLPPSSDPTPPDKSDATDGDPNTFSASRLAKKIGTQTSNGISMLFVPIVALILSMYVTNEMIVYSAPIRLIFFIVTFGICFFFTPFLVILGIYYACKWGYQYYLNHLTDGPKTKIMPTIFALLPLTTTLPTTSLGYFFMYPFTYPKNDKDAKQLPGIMKDYLTSLKKAFTYFDKVKNLPFFAEGFTKLTNNIDHLHDVPPPPVSKSETPLPPTLPNESSPNESSIEPPPPSYNNMTTPSAPSKESNGTPPPFSSS